MRSFPRGGRRVAASRWLVRGVVRAMSSSAALFGLCLACFSGLSAQQQYPLRLELRIGEIDGPNALTNPSLTVLLPDGGLAVAQRQENTVKIFDSAGRLTGSMGRAGRGPGEFRHIGAMGLLGDSALWVADPSNRRVSVFDLTGALRNEVSWPDRQDRMPYRPVLGGTAFVVADITYSPSSPADTVWSLRLYTPDGVLIDTIARSRRSPSTLSVNGRSVLNPLPDGDVHEWTPDGTEVVAVERRMAESGSRATFAITWIDAATRDTLMRASFPYDPVPVPRGAGGKPRDPDTQQRRAAGIRTGRDVRAPEFQVSASGHRSGVRGERGGVDRPRNEFGPADDAVVSGGPGRADDRLRGAPIQQPNHQCAGLAAGGGGARGTGRPLHRVLQSRPAAGPFGPDPVRSAGRVRGRRAGFREVPQVARPGVRSP